MNTLRRLLPSRVRPAAVLRARIAIDLAGLRADLGLPASPADPYTTERRGPAPLAGVRERDSRGRPV